jgi:hypothetical protein
VENIYWILGVIMKIEIRTIKDFVEDLLSDGRSIKEIITVAQNTRWKGHIYEIKEILTNFSKKLKII